MTSRTIRVHTQRQITAALDALRADLGGTWHAKEDDPSPADYIVTRRTFSATVRTPQGEPVAFIDSITASACNDAGCKLHGDAMFCEACRAWTEDEDELCAALMATK